MTAIKAGDGIMRYVVYVGKTCETVDRIRGVYILISESKLYCLVHMYLYVCMCICKHLCAMILVFEYSFSF